MLAVGSVSNDFGTPGAAANSIFLDDRAAADRFRQSLLNHCLRVSRTLSVNPDEDARVRVAIVAGGATGVELAAELYNAAAALGYYGLEVFDESRLQVTLIEAGKRILPALPEKLVAAAHKELEALGVRVLADTPVTEVTSKGVQTASGEFATSASSPWETAAPVPSPAPTAPSRPGLRPRTRWRTPSSRTSSA